MINRKILLTILPIFWPKMPPLGIAFLQAQARKEGLTVDCIDLNKEFFNRADSKLKQEWLISCNTKLEEDILSILESNYSDYYIDILDKMLGYDIIGFSCFKSNFKTTLRMAEILKKRKTGIKIIFGGPEMARQYFKDPAVLAGIADAVVVGEGERAFLEYLKQPDVQNRIYKFYELEDLNNLAIPDYKNWDLKNYPRKNALSVLFSRGCVRRCRFCSEKLLFKKFKTRNIKDVIEEIRFHKENNAVQNFIFHDSMLNADIKKFEALCDAIIDTFGAIPWEAQVAVHPDMSKELLAKMKRSGCYNLFVGLESGSDETLARMNKGFTTIQALDFFKKLNDAGLFFGISLIVGYPGESDANFKETLDFVIRNKELIPKIEQINPFVYYDGTESLKEKEFVPQEAAFRRMEIFVEEIKKNRIKYTNAFLGNLLEKM